MAGRGGQPTRRFYKAGDPYDVTREVPREKVRRRRRRLVLMDAVLLVDVPTLPSRAVGVGMGGGVRCRRLKRRPRGICWSGSGGEEEEEEEAPGRGDGETDA